MTLTFPEIEKIIKFNPNKALINEAKNTADKLMMHVLGTGLSSAFQRASYFENSEIFKVRTQNAISNKDLFARLLQREDMVFTAQGGSSQYPGLSPENTITLDALLDNIRFGMTIRSWVKDFALKAYRCDPMGVIFLEIDSKGNIYPTYKSIAYIFDYSTNGRKLDYICFKLSVTDAIMFGVKDQDFDNAKPYDATRYYRFVDDTSDYILKYDNVLEVQSVEPNLLKEVPGFIASNLIDFSNTSRFISPLHDVVELANSFLNDRSIRDLSKKYSGFPKSIEPLLSCALCAGTGFLSASSCPACTPSGGDRGTGYKLDTKVADVARFPLDSLKDGFDFNKIFGYVAPPIEVWDKQDTSLNDIENTIRDVYWGSYSRTSTTGPTAGENFEETATKTLSDLQPIYARLNMTADWAQTTENLICNFIGKFKFEGSFKKSSRTYGRYYILETPDELMEQYLDMKTKGAPQLSLFDTLRKYYHSLYQTNPTQLAIKLKLINVEPFVHQTTVQVQANNPSMLDYATKLYFSEWLATKDDNTLLLQSEQTLTADLAKYVAAKILLAPELITPPTIGISETIRNTN